MTSLILIALALIRLYMLVLFVRVILDWVQLMARDWRPRGIVLLLANLIYALTDPPVLFLDRRIPALRVGNVGLSMGFLVLYIALIVLQRVLYMFL